MSFLRRVLIAWLGGIILVFVIRFLLDVPLPAKMSEATSVAAHCLAGALGAAIGLKGLAWLSQRLQGHRKP
jgi:hypothetical protein